MLWHLQMSKLWLLEILAIQSKRNLTFSYFLVGVFFISYYLIRLFDCSALICMKNAPNIPAKNFHALTRLDENRAKCQVKEFTPVFY